VSIHLHRPGNLLVQGALSSQLGPGAAPPTGLPTVGFLFGQTAGGAGQFAPLTATGPGETEDLAPAEFLSRLKSRLFSQGLTMLEPLFSPDGHYTPVAFATADPLLEGEETVGNRTFYRLRLPPAAAGGDVILLWVDKDTALIQRSLAFKQDLISEFTETLFLDQDLNRAPSAGDLAFAPPANLAPLNPENLGFSEIFMFGEHLPELVVARKAAAPPPEVKSEEALTEAQLAGVVIIEGDKSVATGFITKIRNLPVVVTNLHVLGTNHTFSVRNVGGSTIAVQSVIGAVGADIALLRIANPGPDLTLLPLADDVVKATKISDNVVTVGNRLGGGVATQTKGTILGLGPSSLEISARFESGNSGSPIFDLRTGEVIGVAAYSETVTLNSNNSPLFLHSADLRNYQQQVEHRWFGFRVDAIAKWETIDLVKWRAQHVKVEAFRDNSLALFDLLSGDTRAAKENSEMRGILDRFDTAGSATQAAGLESASLEKADQLDNTLRELRAFCDRGVSELKNGADSYYDYFRTNPYWTVNISDQLKFREILRNELDNESKDLNHLKQDVLKHM
jgi:S1-C subfamily serine protease